MISAKFLTGERGIWRDKKFGRLSGGEIERVLALFDEMWAERAVLLSSKGDVDKFAASLEKLVTVPNWVPLYQLSLIGLIGELLHRTGLKDEYIAAVEMGVDGMLSFVERLDEMSPPDASAVPAAMAMIGNLEAIAVYSRSVNDMMEAAKGGEIGALIDAISVDSYVLSFPFFLAGIRLEQLSGETEFTEQVIGALSGPHRRRYEYTSLRWLEYLLRDQGAFESCSRDEIYSLIVEHLRLYDRVGEKKDPKAALFALFRKWQKQAGIQNPRFGFSGKRKA